MRTVPRWLRRKLQLDPFYERCALKGYGACDGRITWEHAVIYAGRQVNEEWALVPLCERHHAVGTYMDAGTMDKERNEWVALNRADESTLRGFSKAVDLVRKRDVLNGKFGVYKIKK